MLRGVEKRGELYLSHQLPADVTKLEFCPYEDCLGIGHAEGMSSILVPGSFVEWKGRIDIIGPMILIPGRIM